MALQVLQTTTADVVKLKCIYFKLVNTLKEMEWYGISCKKDEYLEKIETSFIYLNILESSCEITAELDCEIQRFINRTFSFCSFTSTACVRTVITVPFVG